MPWLEDNLALSRVTVLLVLFVYLKSNLLLRPLTRSIDGNSFRSLFISAWQRPGLRSCPLSIIGSCFQKLIFRSCPWWNWLHFRIDCLFVSIHYTAIAVRAFVLSLIKELLKAFEMHHMFAVFEADSIIIVSVDFSIADWTLRFNFRIFLAAHSLFFECNRQKVAQGNAFVFIFQT